MRTRTRRERERTVGYHLYSAALLAMRQKRLGDAILEPRALGVVLSALDATMFTKLANGDVRAIGHGYGVLSISTKVCSVKRQRASSKREANDDSSRKGVRGARCSRTLGKLG